MSSREQLIKIVGIDNVFDSQEAIDSYSKRSEFCSTDEALVCGKA